MAHPRAAGWHPELEATDDCSLLGRPGTTTKEKRVRMWMLQVQYYVPVRETGILLFNSLKGELEEELEDAPVEKLFSTEGVGEACFCHLQKHDVVVRRSCENDFVDFVGNNTGPWRWH